MMRRRVILAMLLIISLTLTIGLILRPWILSPRFSPEVGIRTFPLYSGAEHVAITDEDTPSPCIVYLQFTARDGPDKVQDYYINWARDDGWEVTQGFEGRLLVGKQLSIRRFTGFDGPFLGFPWFKVERGRFAHLEIQPISDGNGGTETYVTFNKLYCR